MDWRLGSRFNCTPAVTKHMEQLGGDGSRMQEIVSVPAGIQSAGQFACEQGIGKFRVAIGLPTVEAPFHWQVADIHVPTFVGA